MSLTSGYQVGHHKSSLSKERTLKSLYIDQLVKILKLQNPRTEFEPTGEYRNGVFDTDPYQTLYLFIDVKTNGTEAWKYISESLQPLRELRYLTGVVKGVKVPGPITVIGTGNTPLSLVSGLDTRDFFYDGPLSGLESRNITDLISPVASTSLTGAIGSIGSDNIPFTDAQLEIIKAQIKVAKSRKILARYWGTPGWPIRKRNEIWRALLNEGVGLLNVDDLRAVGEYF
ncbi:Altered inheritance of mitochondria protein 6 [Ophidiomyces ophidiicola]|nr:Altered inheritance of mitochondria protein 6 [Ophidiomyces ophidiicola]KAI1994692.1 Altered inheritance of mitochondria protein 6 [Ophidiomyces ophidiicola]KAI1996175.1 Altered inheritance of mitochondria protein 6 [Ophidiomyces ophidiicola]KAI2000776.1 Altered inheritance of mitochondria protein 6 [Ophidiomyces ophidiicola]